MDIGSESIPRVPGSYKLQAFKFRAFISYAHADQSTAVWLHRALENYRLPAAVTGRRFGFWSSSVKLGRIFLDDEELKGAPDLGALIRGALAESEWLIVVCSPAAVKSRWVDQEILEFKRIRDESHIIAVIPDQHPNAAIEDCFPKSLLSRPVDEGRGRPDRKEPLGVEIRRFGRQKTCLKVAAALLGIEYEQLRQRASARRKRLATLWSAAVTAALGIFAMVLIVVAKKRLEDRSAILADLAEVESSRLHYDLAVRYAQSGMQGFDHPLLGFNAHKAETQLKRAAVALQLTAKLSGHENEIKNVRFSRDGSSIVTASFDHTARIWSARDGKLLATRSSTRALLDAAVSGNGSKIILVDTEGGIELQDVLSSKPALPLQAPHRGEWNSHSQASILYSGDYSRVLVVFDDNDATLWNTSSWSRLASPTECDRCGQLWSSSFSPASNRLITGYASGDVRLWDAVTGRVLHASKLKESVMAAQFSPDGGLVAVAGGTIRLINATSGRTVGTMAGHLDRDVSLCFSPTGERLLSYTGNELKIWDVGNRSLIKAIRSKDGSGFVNVDFLDGKGRVIQYASESIFMGDIDVTNNFPTTRFLANLMGSRFLESSKAQVNLHLVQPSPTGSVFATLDESGACRLWRTEDGLPVADLNYGGEALTFTRGGGGINPIDFSPDGMSLATISGRLAYVWRTSNSLAPMHTIHLDRTPRFRSLSIAGDKVSILCLPGEVTVWTPSGPEPVVRLPQKFNFAIKDASAARSFANAADLSPDGTRVVTGSDDGKIEILDLVGKPDRPCPIAHPSRIWVIRHSSDGSKILSGSVDGTVNLWDARTCKSLLSLKAVNSGGAPCFSPDQRWFAVGSKDVVRIHDLRSGMVIDSIPIAGVRPKHIEASLDGKRLLIIGESQGAQGANSIWDLSHDTVVSRIEGRIDEGHFSPDGKYVLTAPFGRIYDAETGKFLAGLNGPSRELRSAIWAPDGMTIVTAWDDGSLRVWDMTWITGLAGKSLQDAVFKDKLFGAQTLFSDLEMNRTPMLAAKPDRDVKRSLSFWDLMARGLR